VRAQAEFSGRLVLLGCCGVPAGRRQGVVPYGRETGAANNQNKTYCMAHSNIEKLL